MSILMVSYDLVTPGRDYADLYDALKAYGTWARPVESVWLIETDDTTGDVRDELLQHVDANDKLIVLLVDDSEWATYNLSAKVGKWLDKNL